MHNDDMIALLEYHYITCSTLLYSGVTSVIVLYITEEVKQTVMRCTTTRDRSKLSSCIYNVVYFYVR